MSFYCVWTIYTCIYSWVDQHWSFLTPSQSHLSVKQDKQNILPVECYIFRETKNIRKSSKYIFKNTLKMNRFCRIFLVYSNSGAVVQYVWALNYFTSYYNYFLVDMDLYCVNIYLNIYNNKNICAFQYLHIKLIEFSRLQDKNSLSKFFQRTSYIQCNN